MGIPMAAIDFTTLVDSVADQFEKDTRMLVSPGARGELIRSALPHRAHVEQKLAAGNITVDFLKSAVQTVLNNARDIANSWGQDQVGTDTIQESMRLNCPYLFWC
jgi:hypothetical protein